MTEKSSVRSLEDIVVVDLTRDVSPPLASGGQATHTTEAVAA